MFSLFIVLFLLLLMQGTVYGINGQGVRKNRKVVRRRQSPIQAANTNPRRRRTSTRPYSMDARVIARDLQRRGVAMVNPAGAHVIYPHRRTLRRWQQRLNHYGHIFFFKHNGGAQKRVLAGVDLVYLAIYRLIYPEATAAEIIAFLFNVFGRFLNPPRFYSPSQITKAEQDVGLSRKRSAQTARQAHTPRVINWRRNYWTMPYPFGIANIPARDMIDIDEAVVNSINARRRYAKSFVLVRARHIGPYTRDESVRIILAISGDPALRYRWAQLDVGRSGTNLGDFYAIIDRITAFLNQHQPGRVFTFIMDNLNIHHNPLVVNLIWQRGHRVVFRAPYRPQDGPIEYVFNTIETGLTTAVHSIDDVQDIIRELQRIIRNLPDFFPYFYHCGYR